MINLYLNKPEYEYEIFGLATSFFEGENINTRPEQQDGDELRIEVGKETTFKLVKADSEYTKTVILSEVNDDDKVAFGIAAYDFLSEVTGKELPWGNLTGIRPTKIIRNQLISRAEELGLPYYDEKVKNTVADYLYNTRRLKGSRFELGCDIAGREIEILDNLHKEDGYSVYIGIPFCPSRCLYCSFTSNPIAKFRDKIDEYINCLEKELIWTSENMKDYKLDSIYIGGGTPTALNAEELDRLLSLIITYLPFENVREFTVEAGRPDSITVDKLRVLKKYPVSRISINPQSMKDETLKIIGRNHSVSMTREMYNLAREEGFDNINMDIILGLPGERVADVENTLREITVLAPDSLTVHSLAIKRASKLKQWMTENNIDNDMDFEKAMDMCIKSAADMSLIPYYLYRQKQMAGNLENIGFSKAGKYGIYNILIMEEVQSIVALGAGSVSKRVFADGRIERCDNVKDIDLYLERIDEMIERKSQLFTL